VAGLVCGLVGLFIANVILGPLAIIFGGIAWSRANRGESPRGMAIAGVVLGIVDVALFVLLLALVSHHGGYWHVG
jgi:Na+/proline symporter